MTTAELPGSKPATQQLEQSQPLPETPVAAPTVFATVNTLASYLLEGYWDWQDESPRQWGSNTITINITDLTAAEQALAVRAFLVWEDVCDITFVPTSGAADITFNNNGTGDAFCDDDVSGGLLTSATIQVSSDWSVGAAGGIYSYFFQTYVHEIGHALGLGHQGPYNGTSNYDVDAIFTNDTWRWSIMSYNDQDDADFGDTEDFVITPQMADILAVQSLYGAAQTRTGDTVYGFNSTAGAHYDFSQYFGTPAFTIYDWGGNNDRLDASGYSVDQTIDLTPGEWSSIGGEVHNIGIYLDTVIEDAFGGSARDIIIGNNRSNELRGNGGHDTLLGREGDDFLFAGSGDDQLDGGAGLDTADFTDITIGGVSVDLVNGTAFGVQSGTDTLVSIERANGTLTQRDIFFTSDVDNIIDGNGGDDLVFGSLGNDILLGEDGLDTVDYSSLSVGIIVDLQEQVGYQSAITAAGKSDQLYRIENINGTAFRDILAGSILANQLFGGSDNDDLFGLAGDDVLDGGAGADYMAGGEHDDEYHVDHVNDVVEDGLNQGSDTVTTTLNQYSLVSLINIEALEFTGSGNFVGTGNANYNILTGGAGADSLSGLGGNDALTGGAGNDTLIGGADIDTATFSGNRLDYFLRYLAATQTFEITDLRAGSPEGSDTATGIEQFQFVNVSIDAIAANAQQTLNADGSQTIRDIAGIQPWSSYTDHFDANGRTLQTGVNDDGSTWQTSFDPGNVQPWTWINNEFNPTGLRIRQTGLNDDGTNWQVTFDAANVQPWIWVNNEYSAGGQRSRQTGLNDDGTNWQVTFDANNAQPWTWVNNEYNAAGQRTSQIGLNDNGSNWQSIFDFANVQPWTWYRNEFNAAGQRTANIGLNDNGSNWQSIFDFANVQPWTWYRNEYNAAGQRTANIGLNDNGSSWESIFDFANTQFWTWYRNEFNAAGQLSANVGLNDNGSNWQTLYDVDNLQPWAWQRTNYDAAGQVVSQNGVNDDGSVWSV
jgi:serralysin